MESKAPLTDALLSKIVATLQWRGAKSAAARYAGISRQNFGRWLRERGVERESEALLRLKEFAALSQEQQRRLAGRPKAVPAKPVSRSRGRVTPPKELAGSAPESLPTWML